MPRIEFIPDNWKTSKAKACGEGTPTEDFCFRCAKYIHTEDNAELIGLRSSYDFHYHVGSIGVGHPDYNGEKYRCFKCGIKLTDRDN